MKKSTLPDLAERCLIYGIYRLGHMSDRYLSLLDEKKSVTKFGYSDFVFCKHYIMENNIGELLVLNFIISRRYLSMYIVTCAASSPTMFLL